MRDDSGGTLAETVVAMTISALLMSSVLGVMFASVKMVRAAPTDTNPTLYGTLTASVARLEGSLSAPQRCSNPLHEAHPHVGGRPIPVDSRRDCLTVVFEPINPVAHPDGRDMSEEDEACWVINDKNATAIDKRRLECWELLDHGDLVAYQHVHAEPDPSTPDPDDVLADTSDLLHIHQWQPVSEPFRGRAFGLEALRWDVANNRVHACARIRPDQRREMALDEVPYCEFIDKNEDGKHDFFTAEGFRAVEHEGVSCDIVPEPKPWVCREGYRLPSVRFDTAGL